MVPHRYALAVQRLLRLDRVGVPVQRLRGAVLEGGLDFPHRGGADVVGDRGGDMGGWGMNLRVSKSKAYSPMGSGVGVNVEELRRIRIRCIG